MALTANFNPHQQDFFDDQTSKLLHLSGGFGSGKTFVLAHKLFNLSAANYPHPGAVISQDYQEFKRDVLPEMEAILESADVNYNYHKTDHYFTLPWTPGKLYVMTADKKIRGPNWAYAGINELTLIKLERYKEIIGRVRVKGAKRPQIASVGTPEGYASEYYDYFFEKPPERLRLIYGSTDDNLENLESDYTKTLEDAYDSGMMRSYRKGLWVNMNGSQFYYAFGDKNIDATLEPDFSSAFFCSMDFNVDPFCATLWQFDGYKLYGVDQIKLEGGEGYDTRKMIAALRARKYTPSNTTIFPDPAGRARSTKGKPDVQILREDGYDVRVKNAAPSFRTRQLNVNNLLDKGRIIINPIRCKGIKKDFEGVEQDIITLEKKKDNPTLTHFSDGLDYMTDILFPFSSKPNASRVEKHR